MYFSCVRLLDNHYHAVSQKLPDTALFFVGGCIRDILLGRTTDPQDVDLTAAGTPDEIAARVDTSDSSFFQTKKYGTMTIIPKTDSKPPLQYELTPFRTESGYSDARHPDEITWSNNLVLDSQRRDFTINSLYYTYVAFPHLQANAQGYDYDAIDTDQATVLEKGDRSLLQKQGIIYLSDAQTLVIQSHDVINKCFPQGAYDYEYIFSLVKLLSPSTQPSQIGIIIDPQHGLQDMEQQTIRAVGEADVRINEDALRIMRALRFVIQLNDNGKASFDFEKNTWNALKKRYFQIQYLPKERLNIEIMKAVNTNNFFGFVSLLDEINIMQFIFPSVAANKYVDQPIRYHPFDVYTHTMMVLYHLEKISTDPLLKLAALYHDVGKKHQYYVQQIKLPLEEGRKMYNSWANHTICGAEMAYEDLSKMGMSKKSLERIKWYVAMHMKPGEILFSKKEKRSLKIKKILSDVGLDVTLNLLDLTVADRYGQYNPLQSPAIDDVYTLKALVQEIHDTEGQFTIKELAISGNDLITEYDLTPGPQFKQLLDKAFDRALADVEKRNNKKDLLDFLKDKVSVSS